MRNGSAEEAPGHTGLGTVQAQLGELAGARATLQRALAIEEAAYGPAHPEVAITLTGLGSVHQELGDLPDARAALQRALAIFEGAYRPDHPYVAAVTGDLLSVEQEMATQELPDRR